MSDNQNKPKLGGFNKPRTTGSKFKPMFGSSVKSSATSSVPYSGTKPSTPNALRPFNKNRPNQVRSADNDWREELARQAEEKRQREAEELSREVRASKLFEVIRLGGERVYRENGISNHLELARFSPRALGLPPFPGTSHHPTDEECDVMIEWYGKLEFFQVQLEERLMKETRFN